MPPGTLPAPLDVGLLFVVALVAGRVLSVVFFDACDAHRWWRSDDLAGGLLLRSVQTDVGLRSFPLVHHGQQGEKFWKLLGSFNGRRHVFA